MGVFNRIFKKQSKPLQQVVPPVNVYKEEWDFYLTKINNETGSIMVDLGLFKIAPIKSKPTIVWVSVKMNAPDEEGLSSNQEYDQLIDIEDRLISFVTEKHHAVYAGRLTSNGKRDFYFYMGDTLLYDKTVSESMVAFPFHDFDYGHKEDPDWNNYFDFLYPQPGQFQSMQNRRVLNLLGKQGDKLTKERRVDHWIYFETPEDRDVFINRIKNDGFDIVNVSYNPKSKKHFSLHISRVDKVDPNSIDDYVLYLWKLAAECHGEYDGWETSLEK